MRIKINPNGNSQKILNEKDIIIIKDLENDENYDTLIFMIDYKGSAGITPYVIFLESQWFEIFETNSYKEYDPEYYYKLLIEMLNNLSYELIEIIPSNQVELRRI